MPSVQKGNSCYAANCREPILDVLISCGWGRGVAVAVGTSVGLFVAVAAGSFVGAVVASAFSSTAVVELDGLAQAVNTIKRTHTMLLIRFFCIEP